MSLARVRQSPVDPAFVQDPYPFYARARGLGDLVFWEDYDLVCATTHRAVQEVLRDRRMGREPPAGSEIAVPDHATAFYDIEAHSMLELEPPRHTRLRGLVLRAFTTRRIATLAPEIEALCHDMIDGFGSDQVDLLPAYCAPLPVTIIARLLGVPEDMGPKLLNWSNAMVAMYQARRTEDIERASAAAARDFADFLRGYVIERQSQPADDLITHLIAAEEDGARLSTDELISTCILLLNAGHEATVHTLGNGIRALIEHRATASVVGTEDRCKAAVEEVLRWDPPLHMFTRYIYEEMTIFGHTFRRGDQVACLLGSANRDDTVWPDAARFDPSRAVTTNSAFGAGRHFCIGAPLARLELQIALRVLFQRLPALALVGQPEFADLYHFHGLSALPAAPIGHALAG
ncbi:MAG: cytochrome P450 [Pseudomonadota bacterium]